VGDLLQVRVSKAASGAVDRHAWPAADALDSRQVRRQAHARNAPPRASLLRLGLAVRPHRARFTGAFSVTAATR